MISLRRPKVCYFFGQELKKRKKEKRVVCSAQTESLSSSSLKEISTWSHARALHCTALHCTRRMSDSRFLICTINFWGIFSSYFLFLFILIIIMMNSSLFPSTSTKFNSRGRLFNNNRTVVPLSPSRSLSHLHVITPEIYLFKSLEYHHALPCVLCCVVCVYAIIQVWLAACLAITICDASEL